MLSIWTAACGGPTIRPDPVLPANYPTAEFSACGTRWHGLGECLIKKGQPLDSLDLSITGYAQGSILVTSEKCDIYDLFRYSAWGDVVYPLGGSASESCLLTFVVLPEYPGEAKAGVPIRSFRGSLWVRVAEDDTEVQMFATKLREGQDATIAVKTPRAMLQEFRHGDNAVSVKFWGCGTTFSERLPVVDGQVTVAFSKLFPDLKPTSTRCVLSGRIDESPRIYITWMVWQFGEKYVPLSEPAVSFSDDTLIVDADPDASVIMLDTNVKYNTKVKFKKFDRKLPHMLRVLTTGGRSVVGEWDGKEFQWKK